MEKKTLKTLNEAEIEVVTFSETDVVATSGDTAGCTGGVCGTV